MPDLKELLRMVREMRELQKYYFRTRDKEVLQQSKDAEKRIDHWIAIYDLEAKKQKGAS